MNNTFYFLRHAEVEIDKEVPVSSWRLTKEGKRVAYELAEQGIFDDVDMVVASEESKAIETAEPIAKRLGVELTCVAEFGEMNRDSGGFLPKKDFDRAIKFSLTNLDESKNEWEKGRDALLRFEGAIDRIDSEYENKNVLIVAHGCVVNLYFAHLLGKLHETHARMVKTRFCDFGIVQNGEVVEDIVKEG
ncbi:MAG: histidine phosphatase family protein [bacterium]|nr:histidine phosphatase family protein [bacterium]